MENIFIKLDINIKKTYKNTTALFLQMKKIHLL